MAKSKKELEDIADKTRKKAVDEANKKKATDAAKAEAELAKETLTEEELAFIAETAAKMNEGRACMQPPPADILRYSQLIRRQKHQAFSSKKKVVE